MVPLPDLWGKKKERKTKEKKESRQTQRLPISLKGINIAGLGTQEGRE